MKYYYLTFFNIGIGFMGDMKGAAYFDLSELSGPSSEFGRLLFSYRNVLIDDKMIERIIRWYACMEHNMTTNQFELVVLFLEKHKERHALEFQVSEQVPQ